MEVDVEVTPVDISSAPLLPDKNAAPVQSDTPVAARS